MKSSRVIRRMGRTSLDAVEESQAYRSARRAMKSLKWLAIGGATAGITAGVVASLGVGLAGFAVARKLRTAVELNGKVVLITGSSRGLGLAMAHEFAAAGCKLVLCARDERELQIATEDLARSGATVLGIPCDIGDREQVERMVQQATARFGEIDVLVNNAGIITVGPLESQTLDDFEEAMRVMFWGTVYPTLSVLPHMIARRSGSIANITSIGGKVSMPHLLPYNCAKFASVGFSEGLRAELARFSVKVTTVVPGLMRTGSHVNAYFKGNNQAEYGWFSLGATLPLVSIDARRAARKVLNAVRHGTSEIILTPQARLAATIHGVAPGLTADALGLVNRLLPAGAGDRQRHLGKESENAVSRSFLTRLGRVAAHELNQTPEQRTDLQSRGVGLEPQTKPAFG